MKKLLILPVMLLMISTLSACEEEKKKVENIDKNVETIAKAVEDEQQRKESNKKWGQRAGIPQGAFKSEAQIQAEAEAKAKERLKNNQ